MKTEHLLYISKPPNRLGGKDVIWEKAIQLYNDNHEEKLKLRCHSDYRKVGIFVMRYFDFDPGYYEPGPSGLSQAAKDEFRAIIKEEIDRRLTITLPKDSIRFR